MKRIDLEKGVHVAKRLKKEPLPKLPPEIAKYLGKSNYWDWDRAGALIYHGLVDMLKRSLAFDWTIASLRDRIVAVSRIDSYIQRSPFHKYTYVIALRPSDNIDQQPTLLKDIMPGFHILEYEFYADWGYGLKYPLCARTYLHAFWLAQSIANGERFLMVDIDMPGAHAERFHAVQETYSAELLAWRINFGLPAGFELKDPKQWHRWVLNYLAIGLHCDQPILEVVWPNILKKY
jgi:hypothetical protein